eukprot:3356239-Rhodomonas_salina.1
MVHPTAPIYHTQSPFNNSLHLFRDIAVKRQDVVTILCEKASGCGEQAQSGKGQYTITQSKPEQLAAGCSKSNESEIGYRRGTDALQFCPCAMQYYAQEASRRDKVRARRNRAAEHVRAGRGGKARQTLRCTT